MKDEERILWLELYEFWGQYQTLQNIFAQAEPSAQGEVVLYEELAGIAEGFWATWTALKLEPEPPQDRRHPPVTPPPIPPGY